MEKIIIGSDKSGFLMKEAIKASLLEKGMEVVDCGTQDVDHPMGFFDVAPIVGQKVSDKEFEKAILICGTGMGMSIVANMYPGVHAACCESVFAAEKCRAINDANVLCMGGWVIGPEMGVAMAEKFLATEFTQGLEEWRQEFLKNAKVKVAAIENEIYKA